MRHHRRRGRDLDDDCFDARDFLFCDADAELLVVFAVFVVLRIFEVFSVPISFGCTHATGLTYKGSSFFDFFFSSPYVSRFKDAEGVCLADAGVVPIWQSSLLSLLLSLLRRMTERRSPARATMQESANDTK